MSAPDAVLTATVTSKGQVTIPSEVRRHLDLREGDSLLFRISSGEAKATVTRVSRWRDLAGAFPLPEEWRDASWQELLEHAHSLVAERNLMERSSQTPTSSSDT